MLFWQNLLNGCLDKFLPISTYSQHSMFIYFFTISVKNQARLARKIVCSYLRVFTVFINTEPFLILSLFQTKMYLCVMLLKPVSDKTLEIE